MLKEVPHPDADTRKFIDDELELYVWQDDDELTGFQLWYDRSGTERAIIWTQTNGFERAALDPDNPAMMVIPGGVPDAGHASREFAARCESLEVAIRDFVASHLAKFT